MSEYLSKKAVDVYRAADEILTLRGENERLRATLEKTVNCSTPTEPSGAEQDITEVYVVRNRYKDILYVGLEWNEVEELLAQDASYEYLSYGINIPEGEDKHEHQ